MEPHGNIGKEQEKENNSKYSKWNGTRNVVEGTEKGESGLNTVTFPDSSPLHKTLTLLTGHLGSS